VPNGKLTVKEAAALAPTSPSLVYQWVAERRFPVYRIGAKGKRGKIVIDEPAFRTFLETLKVGAGDATPPPPPRVRLSHIRL
jgi:excisionase family DNA binding protein